MISKKYESQEINAVYTLNYIKECYALNYNSIFLEEVDAQTDSTPYFIVKVGDNSVKAYNHSGQIEVNISRLLQMLFYDFVSFRYTEAMLSVSTIYEHIFNVPISVIFGSIRQGERVGVFGDTIPYKEHLVRNVQWFKNFPFVFSRFVRAGYNEEYYIDDADQPLESCENPDADIYEFKTKKGDKFDAKKYIIIRDYNPEDYHAECVFDSSFDFSFCIEKPTYSMYVLHVNERDNGIFLRWIDKHGMWNSYLFDQGDEEEKIEHSSDSIQYSGLNAVSQYSVNVPISHSSKSYITCSAQHLDNETFDYVKTICSALYVEMFIDDAFKRVSVTTVSVTKNHKQVLNEIEVQVLLDENTYSL